MNRYGKTIRSIRIGKGLSQKDLYTGIISKSYAIGFEQGKHNITINLFEKIIQRLNMNLDEFFFLYRDTNSSLETDLWYEHEKFGRSYDIKQLSHLLAVLQTQQTPIGLVRSALVKARIKIINATLSDSKLIQPARIINPDDLLLIQSFLFTAQTWTLEEIKILANTLSLFEPVLQDQFFSQAQKSFTLYQSYDRGRSVFSSLFIHMIVELIKRNELTRAESYLNQLSDLIDYYEGAVYKILVVYLRGILQIKSGQKTAGHKKARRAVDLLASLDYSDLSAFYGAMLDRIV
ncbi:helix-turn-helix domain-containing protein [Weissella diestrammenae]|uniref:Helix-turn-helix domain-containing protein n=1 Tax=Weissella diestrammenae TaxID=1162633 RepID=A0A7G9T5A1_9LACO|nr:Rgg/GadR/MutR family transcriptional regulator [Weissella diestrammenae]MCM0583134.1 helix-turn-helix domain-containing protein [Weissella diestrammenae]QNN75276.1 helix-turn-helix domain-containing protein [Weissella diestrammenae]